MTSTSGLQARDPGAAGRADGASPRASPEIVLASAASADLAPAPITPEWIIEGAPQARMTHLATSRDKTASVVVWDCTPGRFTWRYAEDETVSIISGEVFITNQHGVERRLAAGDAAFFPAGSSCIWRVTEQVRKVAVLRKDMPHLAGLAVRAWHKLLRRAGLRGEMPL